jgi:hypothetical protein
MSLITKKSTISFLSIGKMAAVCHRVGKNDKKFDNKSKGDDCHHGVYDNNNNN